MLTLETSRGSLHMQLLIIMIPMFTVAQRLETSLKSISKKQYTKELDQLKDFLVWEFQLLEFFLMEIWLLEQEKES